MSLRRASLALLVLAACGDDGGGTGEVDATADTPEFDGPLIDAMDPPDGPLAVCATPDDCPWIDAELQHVVSVLSGAEMASPGVTFTRRASPTERAAVRSWLIAELARNGVTATPVTYGSGTNLVVHLPPTTGPDTGPPIIVGGHFDGVAQSPAAADNATGTAIAVVAARYLAGRPRTRPIDIVLFDQEEAGLIGSGAYAAALGPGAVIHAMHNFDMVSFDGDNDGVVELWSPAPALEALYRQHAASRGLGISAVTFALSDHQSFVERGLPAVGVSEEFVGNDHTPHYHRVTDTLDKINFTFLGRVARLGLAAIEDDAND